VTASQAIPLHKTARTFRAAAALLAKTAPALLAGCTIGPAYQRPEISAPERWRIDYQGAADLANTAWWERFEDPALDALIRTALEENKDLLIAAARVEQYKARLDVDRSAFFPRVGYGAAAGRERLSENRPIPLPRGTDTTNDSYEVGVIANWELDVWGRIRRSTEAARAELLSNIEYRHGVILTLVTDVASSYVQLLALDKDLEIAQRTLDSRTQSLRLFEQKYAGGAVSALELAQVRSSYEEAAAAIPETRRRIALLENALSVLVGRNPADIIRGRKLDGLASPPVPSGIPADVLANRPDVRGAEQDLIAANARIGVARSQYFPTISLTGLFGYASTDLGDLVDSASAFGRLGANAIGEIFTGGRISGQVRETEEIRRQLVLRYQQAIQSALRDVEDALVSHQTLGEQVISENRRVEALRDYARLAWTRFEGGQTDYLAVLDAERTLFNAEIRQNEVRRDLHAALIDIYRAMGGGWQVAIVGQAPTGEPSAGSADANPIATAQHANR
jgi:multidrug efflux system outer membrane protein